MARYGSVDQAGISFTEKEYDYAVDQKKIVLGFIHGDPGSIAVNKVDTERTLAAKLEAFRNKVSTGRLVGFCEATEELELKITKALAVAVTDTPGIGWIRGNAAASETLLQQVNELQHENAYLRFYNAELKEKTKPRLDGIAGLHEMFNVRFRIRRDGDYLYNNRKLPLTWAEIFAAVGPQFFKPASPQLIDASLNKYLQENKGFADLSLELFDSRREPNQSTLDGSWIDRGQCRRGKGRWCRGICDVNAQGAATPSRASCGARNIRRARWLSDLSRKRRPPKGGHMTIDEDDERFDEQAYTAACVKTALKRYDRLRRIKHAAFTIIAFMASAVPWLFSLRPPAP